MKLAMPTMSMPALNAVGKIHQRRKDHVPAVRAADHRHALGIQLGLPVLIQSSKSADVA